MTSQHRVHFKIPAACTAHWELKLVGGTVMNVVFWFVYFALSRSTVSAQVTPLLALDAMIPFWPAAAPIYLTQFLTLPMLALLIDSRDELFAFFRAIAVLSVSCFAIFAVLPTEMPRPPGNGSQSYFYSWIVAHDTTRNAFPSLHAGFGVLSATLATRVFAPWRRAQVLCWISWALTAAVLLAAMLIKQHSVCDILAGAGIGALAARTMRVTRSESVARQSKGRI